MSPLPEDVAAVINSRPTSSDGHSSQETEKGITYLRRLSYVTSAVSICLFILGAAAVLATGPEYPYPINVGGGCFLGFMGMIKGATGFWMCQEVQRLAKCGDVSMSYQRYSWRGVQWIIRWMNLIACILAVVFSGVLATRACIDTLHGNTNDDDISKKACGPHPISSLTLSLLITLFSAILVIMQLAFYVLKRNPVIKDFQRRTENLECQKGKIKIKTITYTRSTRSPSSIKRLP